MNRRRFLGAGLASLGAACGVRAARMRGTPRPGALAGKRLAALADVRRLVVEHADPLLGGCCYVAHLGTRQAAQPILLARRGERFDAVIENALPQPNTVALHGM